MVATRKLFTLSVYSGVLKITPQHDFLDYDIASRHRNEIEQVSSDALNRRCIDKTGKVTVAGFEGCDRFEARERVCLYGK